MEEQRYQDALERAKYWTNNPTVWSSDDICQKLFPEIIEEKYERIKDCIGMCLTDVDNQRFKDYDTSLEECLAWLEKSKSTAIDIDKMVDEFEHSKVISRGIPSLTEVDAYRKGVTDALSKILIGEEKDC